MATPVQSLSLLLEELEDQGQVPPAMRQQLGRIEQLLADWRYIAEDLRERRLRPLSMGWVLRSVRELLLITRPGDPSSWEISPQAKEVRVQADRTLIPAILSLVHNALDAARGSGVRARASLEAGHWCLTISNAGPAFGPQLEERLEREGMLVQSLSGPDELDRVSWESLDYILLDLMLGSATGLDLIADLKARFEPRQLVVLTGYASIATTVEAIKRGASNYMAKPLDSHRLLAVLRKKHPGVGPERQLNRPTPAQLEWEHIQAVLLEHGGNISLTALALGMHRRTLQRKLKKRSPLR